MCSGPSLAHSYGETEWQAKEGCQRITRKSCNLTVETGNLTDFYYARVTAIDAGGQSATKMTDRFSSLQHSECQPLIATGVGREKDGLLRAQKGSASQGQLGMWLFREGALNWIASPVWSFIFLHLHPHLPSSDHLNLAT